MYTIVYKDIHHRTWQDDHVFESFDKVKEYLHEKGFSPSNGVFSRGKYGWCEGLIAYPHRMKQWNPEATK